MNYRIATLDDVADLAAMNQSLILTMERVST
jgi:hypothetical protein